MRGGRGFCHVVVLVAMPRARNTATDAHYSQVECSLDWNREMSSPIATWWGGAGAGAGSPVRGRWLGGWIAGSQAFGCTPF